jgi:tRNA(fMet)-specific endonuclease VapC
MTVFLLDSNVPIRAVKNREPILASSIGRAIDGGNSLALSVISLHELEVGVLRNSNRLTAAKKLDTFLELVTEFWDFDREDALLAAEIRTKLMSEGRVIGAFDVLIAAQALRRAVILVTNNTSEFSRVEGLQLADWTQS